MTKLNPVELGYLNDRRFPVLGFSLDVNNAGCAAEHRHPRAQLIYANSGIMNVISGRRSFIVPPSQAVWLAPDIEHQVYFPGNVSIRNLFLDPVFSNGMPDKCAVLKISPFLSELITRAAQLEMKQYKDSGQTLNLCRFLLDELKKAPLSELSLPFAEDERLKRVMKHLIKKPDAHKDIEDCAKLACVSTRTLVRLFKKETGMSFSEWRRQLILTEAIKMLGEYQSVSYIASSLGYKSLSAFVEMFKDALGVPPGKYFKQ